MISGKDFHAKVLYPRMHVHNYVHTSYIAQKILLVTALYIDNITYSYVQWFVVLKWKQAHC